MCKQIHSALDDLNRAAKRIADGRKVLTAQRSTVATLVKRFGNEASGYNVSVSVDGADVTIACILRNLDGFKDEKLTQILAAFVDAPEQSTSESAAYMNRDFRFKYPTPFGHIRVSIYAYVRTDSPTCRKVLVGSELVTRTEEKYEIVCD